jgi:hypothetical protein
MRIIHKALGISLLVHLVIVVFFAVLPFVVTKKRYTPVYQVNLVTQPEPSPKEPQVVPEKKKPPVKPPTEVKKKAPPVTRKKTEKKKPEVRPKKDTQSEQSLDRVQRAIDKIKKKMVVQDRIHQEQLQTSRILEGKRNAYFDSIAAHIQANWSLLKNQMEDVGFLTTDLGLQIRRDGTISNLFDEFAVRAVKRSTPLPPFPDELKESKLEVTIGLSS